MMTENFASIKKDQRVKNLLRRTGNKPDEILGILDEFNLGVGDFLPYPGGVGNLLHHALRKCATSAPKEQNQWRQVMAHAIEYRPDIIDERIPSLGMTPLAYAIQHGLKNVFNDLVEAGADPAAKDMDGETPLTKLCRSSWGKLDPVMFIFFIKRLIGARIPLWNGDGADDIWTLTDDWNDDDAHVSEEIALAIMAADIPLPTGEAPFWEHLPRGRLTATTVAALETKGLRRGDQGQGAGRRRSV